MTEKKNGPRSKSNILDTFLMATDLKFEFEMNKPLNEMFTKNIQNLAEVLNSKVGLSVLAIITENEEIADAFYSQYLQPRRTDSKVLLQAGINRGESFI
ncbi:TetR-like C-terminal domain-containing protein [Paenibacillus sp. FA6]|uniref:TetR-like C-terminal domain-containing protein n=1 Tax=Paenibacillus sp. FA6 TaxID=3413029 RepID=UPI003F659CF6